MSCSRLPTMLFRRAMHTSGRHIPHPPLGGAGTKGPGGSAVPPPQAVAPHPPAPSEMVAPTPPISAIDRSSGSSPLAPSSNDEGSDQTLTDIKRPKLARTPGLSAHRRRKPLSRPARTIPVTLPNGRPEPTTWPVTKKYTKAVADIPESETPVHPLWKFFWLTSNGMDTPEAGQKTPLELGAMGPRQANPGRAWTAPELRLKSFAQLHTLWYLCLRERNMFATRKEERRRVGMMPQTLAKDFSSPHRAVRKTMARIKHVLQERRLGLIAAYGPYVNDGSATLLPEWADPTASQTAISYINDDPAIDVRRSPRVDSYAPPAGEEEDAVVENDEVAQEEVESRDEGFGGGEEAKQFVEETEVDEDDGRVKKA